MDSSAFLPSASYETLVVTPSSVHKYDVGGVSRFDKRVARAVMRTEGVIKVGLMMEERIFDFDRQCGSHAGRFWFYLCLCTFFTLSLFTKRDRVGCSTLPILITLAALVKSLQTGSKLVSLSCPTWIGRRPRPCGFFSHPSRMAVSGTCLSPVFSPSLASLGATKRPYGHVRYDILVIVLPRLVVAFLPSVVLCFQVPDRIMCTHTCDHLSPVRPNKSLGNTALGLIVPSARFISLHRV